MVPNFRCDTVNSGRELIDDPRCPTKASRAKAALQMIRLLDSQAWQATRGAPFQFVRWIGALATVVVNWVECGNLQSAASYVPVLLVVAVLLLPDAQSIEIAGVRFDRVANEMARQRRAIGRLFAEVALINNWLIAGSQVNITLGATAVDAALAATAVQSGGAARQSSEAIGPNLAAEGIRADREQGISKDVGGAAALRPRGAAGRGCSKATADSAKATKCLVCGMPATDQPPVPLSQVEASLAFCVRTVPDRSVYSPSWQRTMQRQASRSYKARSNQYANLLDRNILK